jgi:hypothetical protein
VADREDVEDDAPDDAELDGVLRWRELPEEVKRKRWIAHRDNEYAAAVLQSRIDGHLQAYATVLDALDEAHRNVGDYTDLDLAASSRQAAVWLVAGRCIACGRAALALLAAGFGAESTAPERMAHEATRLLSVLADEDEPTLLRRWLADEGQKWVRPRETREAQERMRRRLRDTMVAAKAAAEAAGETEQAAAIEEGLSQEWAQDDSPLLPAGRQLYDVLSRVAHSRRSGVRDAVSVELRQMATGPHPDPRIRAEYVFYGGMIVEEVALAVGDALGRFYGPGWFLTQVKPLIDTLTTLREMVPLTAG